MLPIARTVARAGGDRRKAGAHIEGVRARLEEKRNSDSKNKTNPDGDEGKSIGRRLHVPSCRDHVVRLVHLYSGALALGVCTRPADSEL